MAKEAVDTHLNLRFIQDKFREYYSENASKLTPPSEIEKREFGFIPLKREKQMIRHRGFRDAEQLRDFIKALAPSDAYYSSAYYQQPDAETMGEKGWLGADLIFDVDCDHLPTPCKEEHDEWRCVACGKSGRGSPPAKCPKCRSERLEAEMWICERCLEATKQELLKLIGILEDDFGILDKEMTTAFSGHRGYHLHIESNAIKSMTSSERKELVDYVTATGLNPERHGLLIDKRPMTGPPLGAVGWGGRLAQAVYTLMLKGSAELREAGVEDRVAKKIDENLGRILKVWESGDGWGPLGGLAGPKTVEKILHRAKTFVAASIDTVVTTDIRRLIRLPDTLHGKTGLRVVAMPVPQLVSFEPLRDALAFTEGSLRVRTSEAPKIRVGEEFYGPFRDEVVELPMAVAMFLICRNKASPS